MTTRGSTLACMAAGLCLLVAGCTATQRADDAELAQQAIVGMSRSDLLSCAGTPDRSREIVNGEILTYESLRQDRPIDAHTPVFTNSTRSGVLSGTTTGGGFGASSTIERNIRSDYCEASFTVINGTVTSVDYRSPGGFRIGGFGTRHSECADIVASCLDQFRAGISQD